jgi:hypothetical protein
MITVNDFDRIKENQAKEKEKEKEKERELELKIDEGLLRTGKVVVGSSWIEEFFIIDTSDHENEIFKRKLAAKYAEAGWMVSQLMFRDSWAIYHPTFCPEYASAINWWVRGVGFIIICICICIIVGMVMYIRHAAL